MSNTELRETFKKNLRNALYARVMTQKDFAKAVGVSAPTVNEWLKGKKIPRMDKIDAICSVLMVSRSDLMDAHEPPAPPAESEKPHKKGVLIPVLGVVRAGVPIHAEEDIIDYEEIPQEMARGGEYFGLRVTGSSMEPTLRDGDVIIVRKQPDVDNGDIAIVLVDGEDATVKEIRETPEGITLIGHNVAVYQPHFYSNKEVETLPVRIIGRVVELRRKF